MGDILRRDLDKQESRRLDAERLARGEITPDMLRQENDFFRSVDFSGWRNEEVIWLRWVSRRRCIAETGESWWEYRP